ELNPDALSIAESLDRERKQKGARGPLHGIPALIKDNIDTADGMQTTAGSLALVGSKPAQDSGVARKLREAGAVILGKTNLSEWANIRSTIPRADGAGAAGSRKILMLSSGIRADRVPVQARPLQRTFVLSQLEPRLTAQSCAHHRQTGLLVLSRRWG